MRPLVLLCALSLFAATGAAADAISFDEIPAHNSNRLRLAEEYAHLGVHFVATDDGAVWDGMSNGDPGGWELEGTHGPSFVGFNGRSYSLTVHFDMPVPAFRLDVAAASGAEPDGVFSLEGYREGALVDATSVVLGAPNEWITVALEGEVDEVFWLGDTRGFRPFGADNMRWGLDGAPSMMEVAIDVRPDSSENPLNPASQGVVPVALLGSGMLDVMDVDPASLMLGVMGAPAEPRSVQVLDVNGDGWMDLVANYRVADTGTAYGDTSICLTAMMMDGTEMAGCDAIRTVPGSGASASSRKAR